MKKLRRLESTTTDNNMFNIFSQVESGEYTDLTLPSQVERLFPIVIPPFDKIISRKGLNKKQD